MMDWHELNGIAGGSWGILVASGLGAGPVCKADPSVDSVSP